MKEIPTEHTKLLCEEKLKPRSAGGDVGAKQLPESTAPFSFIVETQRRKEATRLPSRLTLVQAPEMSARFPRFFTAVNNGYENKTLDVNGSPVPYINNVLGLFSNDLSALESLKTNKPTPVN